MTLGPNLLNRIVITIEANDSQVAKKVLHGSLLNQASINNLFNTFFTQHPINQDIYLETLTLNLGEIDLHNFNLLFPARLNTALNRALSQYQINNQERKTALKQSTSQEIINQPSLLHENNSINIESFIHYLNHKNPMLNSQEIIANHKNVDSNIQQLITQLAEIENKWALLLAKSCLSEPSLQRLSALKQPALLSAINHRLSGKINRPHHSGELVSPGQLILNALQYIQRNNISEIPKLDAKVISHVTIELDDGTLNAESVMTLFRQIITHNITLHNAPLHNVSLHKIPLYNISLNSWLKQIWQTTAIARFSDKYLSTEEYQYFSEQFTSNNIDKESDNIALAVTHKNIQNTQKEKYLPEHFIPNHTSKNESSKQSTIINAPILSTQEQQYLPEHFIPNHTNRNKLSKLSTINDANIQHAHKNQYISESYIQNHKNENKPGKQSTIINTHLSNTHEEQCFPEYFIPNNTNKNKPSQPPTIADTDNKQTQKDQYIPEHYIQNYENKNKSSKQSIMTNTNIHNTHEKQYISKNLISNYADKYKSSKKSAVTQFDIHKTQQYQYMSNPQIIPKNQKILSTSNNRHITSNHSNQLRTINKVRTAQVLLPEQTPLYQVNNAGILVLWPMLPMLFNQLGLLEDQKFIHRQAQFSAVNFLNYLIWGSEEIKIEPRILDNILCGLMVDETIELFLPEPEKQLIIDQWLDAIINQLTGWKKLSHNDVRQLFLQRPGELLINEQEIEIMVEHQPFDILLSDWPWPLNIARFPWLNRTLQINWQNI
ncbi:contractile injection system tape measure protein [Photorhabdus namnaonensis]|uniref:Uncharacterized protein n=1 Tax=Photorhabdus namnaonensis TaxID=1851568 RepID=A0A1B8YGR4_9GAMM|nr:contractile injection system tape measure protein [Photorhabdus namnaonensis]OCA54344.1 hypothetical protein Phpb_02788 [Photorhabdus namnaonensis]